MSSGEKVVPLNPDDWSDEVTQGTDSGGRLEVADHPLPYEPTVPADWVVSDDGIFRLKVTKAGSFLELIAHAPIFISERLVDDDGAEALRLTWPRDGTWREKVYERDEVLISHKVHRLAGDGAPVGGRNPAKIAAYLLDMEAANLSRIPRRRMTRSLGWLGDGADEFISSLDATDVGFKGLPGTDSLAAAFRSSGTLVGWQAAVGGLGRHPHAALGVYAALAAPLLRVLDVPSFTVDWAGETSVGKTTTLRVAASVWGHPDLVKSWDATPVAIEHFAGTLTGLPLLLDETKRAQGAEHVAQVLYAVSQGEGRHRGRRDGGLRETVTWSTVVLTTGEQPITTFTEDGGTRGRVVSVWGSPFGEVRDHTMVRQLTRNVGQHYGHAGPLFVSELLRRRDEWPSWRGRYDRLVDKLAAGSGNAVVQRRAALVAALMTAGGLARKFGIVDWKPPATFWRSLLRTGAGADDDDQARQALGIAWDWATAHEGRFTSLAERHTPRQAGPYGWAGRWDEPTADLAWLPDVLRRVLEGAGHEADAVIRTWLDRGWLRPNGDGGTRVQTRLERGRGGKSTRMVVIKAQAVRWLSGVGVHALPHPLTPGDEPPTDDAAD